jgi:hypothetical protein
MIEQLTDFPPAVVAFACKGRVTRLDYETVLVPVVEAALKQHRKVRLYYRTDSDFSGIDPGAMWEDFKVGMAHLFRWERIAVVTNVDWIRHDEMQAWLRQKDVHLVGGDLDEAPQAYRRLPDVLKEHAGTVKSTRCVRSPWSWRAPTCSIRSRTKGRMTEVGGLKTSSLLSDL